MMVHVYLNIEIFLKCQGQLVFDFVQRLSCLLEVQNMMITLIRLFIKNGNSNNLKDDDKLEYFAKRNEVDLKKIGISRLTLCSTNWQMT